MEILQPEASVVQTGLGIRYVGEFAYAYSGAVGVPNSSTVLIDTTSGSGIIVGRIYTGYCSPSNIVDDMTFEIKLNGELVSARYLDTSKEKDYNQLAYITIVIPPITRVVVTSTNVSSSTERDMCCLITGRVYGAK